MRDLEGKTAVVTGGGRGIGKAVVERFVAEGARVAVWDLDGNLAREAAQAADPTGTKTLAVRVDVTEEAAVSAAAEATVSAFGGIDVLVNSAGVLRHKPIEEMSLEDFEWVVRVNLTGTFLCCRAAVPHMKRRGGGKIVNVASLGGRTGRPGVGVNYAASKAGVIGLTQLLARELGPSRIYVNAIAPGPILTELTKQVPPEVFATWNAGRAVPRDGLPEDVAELALFLASPRSDWITGTTTDINGGILIR